MGPGARPGGGARFFRTGPIRRHSIGPGSAFLGVNHVGHSHKPLYEAFTVRALLSPWILLIRRPSTNM